MISIPRVKDFRLETLIITQIGIHYGFFYVFNFIVQLTGYLKSKSSLMIFDKHANLKYKYGNRHFWCRGYYVDTVGRYEGAIKEYIRNQLQEDIAQDTLNFKEYMDPFTGEQVK